MRQPRVLVVGGGAAGLCAAASAARAGAAVTLAEAGDRVGRKILASGNGRCNLSNLHVAPSAYNDPAFVEPVLAAYGCPAIRDFFGELGLLTYADDEGRIYPVTNAAASVLEVLRLEIAHLGVEERYGFEVASVASAPAGGFEITSSAGVRLDADAVIVASGGGSPVLAQAGHTETACAPVLGPLKTETAPIRGLSGVRVKCAASLLDEQDAPVATERGELLFREYGVSGIMVFDLSRALDAGRVLAIDFLPDISPESLEQMLQARLASLGWRSAGTFFDGMLHSRVADAVLRAAGADPSAPASTLSAACMAGLLKGFRLDVLGIGDPRQAQVTRGGASTAEFDPATMESRLAPGLYAAGEVLDVDGRCGGFNLHWAWASGIVAGRDAARSTLARAAGGSSTDGPA